MGSLLLVSLFVSGVTIGLHVCTWEKMLLERLRNYFSFLPLIIYKPLIDCVYCMPSLYTALLLFVWSFKHGFHWVTLLYFLLIALPSVAINALVYPAIVYFHLSNDKLEAQAAYIKKREEYYAKHQAGSGTGVAADEPAAQRGKRYYVRRNH